MTRRPNPLPELPECARQFLESHRQPSMRHVVFSFDRWIRRRGIELQEVTLRHIYEYLEKPAWRSVRGRARHEYERRIRHYVGWLDERGHLHLDASLIGGVKIVIGDKVIDGTVRGKLDAMAAALTH